MTPRPAPVPGIDVRVRWNRRRLVPVAAGLALIVGGAARLGAGDDRPIAWLWVDDGGGGGESVASAPPDTGTVASPPATHDALLARQPVPATSPAPVEVHLDRLDVHARVVATGVDAAGGVDVPADVTTAGWYRYGSAPADATGSTVVVGHVDMSGRRGVFFRLGEARVGDTVTVLTTSGARQRYRVAEAARVPKLALTALGTFRHDGPPVLTLVTCGGPFDAARHAYADNVVVVAEPIA